MPKRITQKEAEKRSINVGCILLETYFGNKNKHKFKCCNCDNIFYRRPNHVWDRKQTHCKECVINDNIKRHIFTQEEAEKKTILVGCELIGKYAGNRFKTEFRCANCKNIFIQTPNKVWDRKTIYCLKCSIRIRSSKRRRSLEQIYKICNRHGFVPLFADYKNCNQDILVKCQCGRKFITKMVYIQDGLKSCGNCHLKRSSRYTSHTALKLHNIIEKILNHKCKHNKHINGKCFDIICDELKIAIEFDSYYWHRVFHNTTKREHETDKIAKISGYKLLRIRSNGYELPTEKQLKKVFFDYFGHNYKKWTITLKSWNKAKIKYMKHREK